MRISFVVIFFVLIIAAALFEVNMYVVLAGIVLIMYKQGISLCDYIVVNTNEQLTNPADNATPNRVDFTKPDAQLSYPPEVIVPQPPVEFTSTVRKPPVVFDEDIYGPYYAQWNDQRKAYTDSYAEAQPRVGVSCAERQYDVDSAGALLAQRRTVDRQRNDGWAAKDADYYRYHFAEELDTEENLRWWGREEW